MKKCLFTLSAMIAVASVLNAQRLTSLSVSGLTPLTPYASVTPTNNSTTSRGVAELVFPSAVDLTNVAISFGAGTASSVACYDYSVSPAVPMPTPTDWSNSAASPVIVRVTGGGTVPTDWAEYNTKLKKLISSPLPMTISTGGANFSDSWTPSTVGWAATAITPNKPNLQLGAAGRSVVIGFSDAPDSLIFTIKIGATSWPTNNVFNVDGSADGITWASIVQYNATNLMPNSTTSTADATVKLKIDPNFRYVRYIYTTKPAAGNVGIDNIRVTKSVTTGVNKASLKNVKIYPGLVRDILNISSEEPITEIYIIAASGQKVRTFQKINGNINVANLADGVYLAQILFKDGSEKVTRFVKQ